MLVVLHVITRQPVRDVFPIFVPYRSRRRYLPKQAVETILHFIRDEIEVDVAFRVSFAIASISAIRGDLLRDDVYDQLLRALTSNRPLAPAVSQRELTHHVPRRRSHQLGGEAESSIQPQVV